MLLITVLQAAAYSVVFTKVGAVLGAAIVVLGASYGISRIGISAMEAIARQPEASNDIRANMILAAALVEGAALFAIIIGFLAMVL